MRPRRRRARPAVREWRGAGRRRAGRGSAAALAAKCRNCRRGVLVCPLAILKRSQFLFLSSTKGGDWAATSVPGPTRKCWPTSRGSGYWGRTEDICLTHIARRPPIAGFPTSIQLSRLIPPTRRATLFDPDQTPPAPDVGLMRLQRAASYFDRRLTNDQINRCCLRSGLGVVGAGHATRTPSTAGRHGHYRPRRMWPG